MLFNTIPALDNVEPSTDSFSSLLSSLAPEVVVRPDGWQSYRVLNSESSFHIPIVTGLGKNAVNLFPWVHS